MDYIFIWENGICTYALGAVRHDSLLALWLKAVINKGFTSCVYFGCIAYFEPLLAGHCRSFEDIGRYCGHDWISPVQGRKGGKVVEGMTSCSESGAAAEGSTDLV